jgi:hypothetical protein
MYIDIYHEMFISMLQVQYPPCRVLSRSCVVCLIDFGHALELSIVWFCVSSIDRFVDAIFYVRKYFVNL